MVLLFLPYLTDTPRKIVIFIGININTYLHVDNVSSSYVSKKFLNQEEKMIEELKQIQNGPWCEMTEWERDSRN